MAERWARGRQTRHTPVSARLASTGFPSGRQARSCDGVEWAFEVSVSTKLVHQVLAVRQRATAPTRLLPAVRELSSRRYQLPQSLSSRRRHEAGCSSRRQRRRRTNVLVQLGQLPRKRPCQAQYLESCDSRRNHRRLRGPSRIGTPSRSVRRVSRLHGFQSARVDGRASHHQGLPFQTSPRSTA